MAKRTTNRFVDEVLTRRESFQEISERTAASMRRELLRIRRESTRILRRNLGPFVDPEGNLTSTGAARLAAQRTVDDVNDVLRRGLTGAESKLGDARLRGFRRAAADAEFSIDAGAGQKLTLGSSTSQIFEEAARQAASRPVLGIPANRQLRGVLRATAQKNREIITGAVLNGEAIGDTAEKLKQAGDLNNAAAVRIARNNMNAVANDAHRAVYEANSDIFSGYKWDATFDNRTTAICARLHGTIWPLGSAPPGPPAHQNCRSVLVGVFKDPEIEEFAQAGERRVRKYNKTGEETGKELISSNKRFDEWLRTQPSIVQNDIAGSPLKGKLFRQGKIDLRDIVGDDLLIRGDRQVVRRALAKSPADEALKSLADDLGVRPVTQAIVEQEDLRLARKAVHDLGDDAGMTSHRSSVDSITTSEERLLKNVESRVSKTKRRIQDLDDEIGVETNVDRRRKLLDKKRALETKQRANIAERNRLRRLRTLPPEPVPPQPIVPADEPPVVRPPTKPLPGEPLPLTGEDLEAAKRRLRSVESTLSRNRKKIRGLEAQLNNQRTPTGQIARVKRGLQDLNGKQGLLIEERDALKVRIRAKASPVTTASKRRRIGQLKETSDPVGKKARGTDPAKLDKAELDDIAKKQKLVDEAEAEVRKARRQQTLFKSETRRLKDELFQLVRAPAKFERLNKELSVARSGLRRAQIEVVDAQRRVRAAQRPLTKAWRGRRTRLAPDLRKPTPLGTTGEGLDAALKLAREEMKTLGLTKERLASEGADSFLDALRAANRRTKLNNDQLTIVSKMRRGMRLAVKSPSKATLERWSKTMRELLESIDEGLTRDALLQQIDWNALGKVRAGANRFGNSITMGSADENWKVLHEFAHHIEYRNSRVSGRVQTWLRRRTRGETPTPLWRGSNEVSRKDRFWHDYTGRVYDDGRMAEGFTQGFEALFDSVEWQEILKKDFEHVELIWSLLRGY
ncbi:hypothetical protein LCGC14_0401450 [marine sediment metagenome]|uniref:Phage head morphogenesis domain-containing protein n=1 Tax=marine sediment metagenome TaxID=412755 RepID=A0A0F9TES5_9ZZZZ